jgi:hypothetical protein
MQEEPTPLTFLCDRETIKIPGSQPGFINFCVVPMLDLVIRLAPNLNQLKTQALECAAFCKD